MAYKNSFLRLTMNGEVANGADIWSSGIHLSSNTAQGAQSAFDLMQTTGAMTALANIVADFIADPRVRVPAGVTLESIKLAHLDINGKYVEAALEEERFAQGNLNAPYAPQLAIVNTLDSGKFKDPGKYNRFYLPVALGGTGDNWCLTPQQQIDYAACTAEFIAEVNEYFATLIPIDSVEVAVLSNSGTGYDFAVQSVRIGRVFDNQRRRRNKIDELYVTAQVSN